MAWFCLWFHLHGNKGLFFLVNCLNVNCLRLILNTRWRTSEVKTCFSMSSFSSTWVQRENSNGKQSNVSTFSCPPCAPAPRPWFLVSFFLVEEICLFVCFFKIRGRKKTSKYPKID